MAAPAPTTSTTPHKKKNNDFQLFLIFFLIIIFPITIGVCLAWLFTRLARVIYAITASLSRPSSLHKFKIWYFVVVMSLQLILLSAAIFWFFSDSIHNPFKDMKPDDWNAHHPGEDHILEILEWLASVVTISFLIVILFNDAMIAYTDNIIHDTELKDMKKVEDANAAGQTIEFSHPFLNFIGFCTSYKYSKKVNITLEKKLLTSKIKANIDNGMIVNKNQNIMFLKKFWPKHVLFVGTSNTGKTNDISNWMLSAAYLNCPIMYVYLDYADENIEKDLDAIATTLNKTHTSINFLDKSVQYDPCYKKDEEEIISMFVAAVTDPSNEKQEKSIKEVVTSVISFMQQNSIPLTIENIFMNMDPVYLKKTYLLKTKISKYYSTSLIEAISSSKDYETILFFKYVKDIQKTFHGHFSSSPTALNLYDILTTKHNNSIFSVSIPTSLPPKTAKLLERLFMQDIKINASYAESQRAIDKTKTILCFSGFTDLFNSDREVTSTLNFFSSKQICFGYGVRTFSDKIKTDDEIFKQIFNSCGTYFIHKNTDLRIKENLLSEISNDRLVSPGFMIDDVVSKYKKRKINDEKDIQNAEAGIQAIKKTLVENSSYLPIGQIIFKSTVSENTNTSLGYKLEKDIVFNTPIQCMLFNDYLNYVKDKLGIKDSLNNGK